MRDMSYAVSYYKKLGFMNFYRQNLIYKFSVFNVFLQPFKEAGRKMLPKTEGKMFNREYQNDTSH